MDNEVIQNSILGIIERYSSNPNSLFQTMQTPISGIMSNPNSISQTTLNNNQIMFNDVNNNIDNIVKNNRRPASAMTPHTNNTINEENINSEFDILFCIFDKYKSKGLNIKIDKNDQKISIGTSSYGSNDIEKLLRDLVSNTEISNVLNCQNKKKYKYNSKRTFKNIYCMVI